jgi:hypothetical protein
MNFDGLPLDFGDCEQARSQIGQWLQAIVATLKPARRVRLVDPHGDRRLPKLYQLQVASSFFLVPRWHFDVKATPKNLGPMLVTKPLGDPSVGGGKIFYSRYVNGSDLVRPYPWFVQEALIGGHDVTCVHVHGRNHFYVCDFLRSDSAVDWRVEINSTKQSPWRPLAHPRLTSWGLAVNGFMERVNLHYGRLDFILQGDELYFLECNSNGQFGWLDDPRSLRLHREFLAAALDAETAVT